MHRRPLELAPRLSVALLLVASAACSDKLPGGESDAVVPDASARDGADGRDADLRDAAEADAGADWDADTPADAAPADGTVWDAGRISCEPGRIDHLVSTGQEAFVVLATSAGGAQLLISTDRSLVPEDHDRREDVYVVSVADGAPVLVSTTGGGTDLGGWSVASDMSADGRLVLFASNEPLVPTAPSGVGLFLANLETRSIRWVAPFDGNLTVRADMDDDGRWAVWDTTGSEGLPDANGDLPDVVALDLQTGAIRRVNTTSDGVQGDGWALGGAISPDGQAVAFLSNAGNLLGTLGPRSQAQVFVHDLVSGQTEVVSTSTSGLVSNVGCEGRVSLSREGRFVAFACGGNNLVPGQPANSFFAAYVKDRSTGTLTVVPGQYEGTPEDVEVYRPLLSPSGRYVAFASPANLLGQAPNCRQFTDRHYLMDLGTGDLTGIGCSKVPPAAELPSLGQSRWWPLAAWSADESFYSFVTDGTLVEGTPAELLDAFVYHACIDDD